MTTEKRHGIAFPTRVQCVLGVVVEREPRLRVVVQQFALIVRVELAPRLLLAVKFGLLLRMDVTCERLTAGCVERKARVGYR